MVEITGEIPIIILAFISGLVVTLLSLGYVYRTSFPMSFMWFLSGAIFIMIFLSVNAFILGYTDERSINTNTIILAEEVAQNITLTHYNVTTGSTNWVMSNVRPFIGESLTSSSSLIGDTINSVCLKLSKVGSPTGNAVIGVWSNSANPTSSNFLAQFGTQNVASLTTTPTLYCYEFSDYTLASGEIVGIYHNTGSAGTQPQITADNTDPFDGVNTHLRYFQNSAWTNQLGNDFTANMTYTVEIDGEDAIEIKSHDTVGNTPIVYAIKVLDENGEYTAEPTFVGIMLLMLALSFVMIGILIERFN